MDVNGKMLLRVVAQCTRRVRDDGDWQTDCLVLARARDSGSLIAVLANCRMNGGECPRRETSVSSGSCWLYNNSVAVLDADGPFECTNQLPGVPLPSGVSLPELLSVGCCLCPFGAYLCLPIDR